MFSYSENIAHFKGGISYEVQKSFYLVVQVVAASIVATSIITAQPVYTASGNVFDENRRPIVGML